MALLRMFRQLRRVRALSEGQRPRSRSGGAHVAERILPLRARSGLVLLSRRTARGSDCSRASRENNGHIDRKLSFPVEDLYVDGQPAGQVGQEIYGAGAAFVFASRAFHQRAGCALPHLLRSLPAGQPTAQRERSLSFQLGGGEGAEARLELVRTGRAKLPEFTVTTGTGEQIAGSPARRSAHGLDGSGERADHGDLVAGRSAPSSTLCLRNARSRGAARDG